MIKYLWILGYALLFAYFINKLCYKINKRKLIKVKIIAIIIGVTLSFSILSFLNDYYFFGILLLLSSIIVFHFLTQYSDIKNLVREYKNVVNYVNSNEDLIQKYRYLIHENRNQLIYIRKMVNKKNTELINYIDNLLDSKQQVTKDNEWIENSLRNIKINGLRGFLEFKLNDMKKAGIILEISISEDIKKINNSILSINEKEQLYTIIGVLIDNAKEALLEKNEKNFALHMYIKNNKICILFANTIKNYFDSTFIYRKKYTTKGKEHGNGLSIIKKIAKKNKIFNLFTDIYDNYFVQTLIIEPKIIKK